MTVRSTRFRLFVHTAYEGYAWQGCDESLAAALDAWRSETGVWNELADPGMAPTANNPVGGLLRYTLDGTPGLFLWRVHVRKRGDARRRDSRYAAVLFLPLDGIAGLRIDFARLWNAPLLRAPQSGDLSGLFVDLCDPAWPCAIESAGTDEDESAWLSDCSEETPDGDETSVLAPVSRWFQSSGTEFGNLVAVVFPAWSGTGIRAELRYRVFPEVEEAETLRDRLVGPEAAKFADSGFAERMLKTSESLSLRAEALPTFGRLAAYAQAFARNARPFSSLVAKPDAAPREPPVPVRPGGQPPSGSSPRTTYRRFGLSPFAGLGRGADGDSLSAAGRRRFRRRVAAGYVFLALVLLAVLALFLAARKRRSPPEEPLLRKPFLRIHSRFHD